MAHGKQLVTSVEYRVLDRPMTSSAADLQAALTMMGADGWWCIETFPIQYQQRRIMFKQVGGVVEYLVGEADTGRSAEATEAVLDMRGAEGWELIQLFDIKKDRRRAIYARGGAGGGGGDGGNFPEAPVDDVTYGRRNAAWNPSLALNNDTLDGGNF